MVSNKSKQKQPVPKQPLHQQKEQQQQQQTVASTGKTDFRANNQSQKPIKQMTRYVTSTNAKSRQNSSSEPKHSSYRTGKISDSKEGHKGDPIGHRKNHFSKMKSNKGITGIPCFGTVDGFVPVGSYALVVGKGMCRGGSNCRNKPRNDTVKTMIIERTKPVPSASTICGVVADMNALTIFEKSGTGRHRFPLMQCGTLEVPDSYQRSSRMDAFQFDDGFHSDGGTETPPPSPSSGSSIASTSDHGSLESVDTGGSQRLAVLSFEQVRKLNDVMNETVAIHGRGNFPTLEVKLKDLVTLVRKKLEIDVANGGAGMKVKDIRLNGGAASHVLASEAQPYNDLDLIFAVEFSSNRHFDRVKSAVLSTLLDLLPEGVSRRRISPCSLKEAYVGKMVKVNNNNDGDRWSLISLGNSPGHKNVELKFVDTMRRQFEFSVDSFQIVLDSLLLFYDCAALPISENFYPTVVGESVYGDFQEALYHLQKKLISTRQPEEIRGGGLLKYCNLLVRNYQPVDSEKIKTLERYMCSRFFIDFPDITTQTVKLEAYLRNHFWGVDEEPLQYQYLMHLRGVVETSTVCLMGHERRQTLMLIQTLAMQVLCREQQKQQHQQAQQSQQSAQTQQQQSVQTSQQQPNQSQSQQQQPTATAQQIQIQPPGLLYANGVYYAPVIPTTICTCNSTWLTTATILSPQSLASPSSCPSSASSSVVPSPVSSVIASPCLSPYPRNSTPEPSPAVNTINIIPQQTTDSIPEILVNYSS